MVQISEEALEELLDNLRLAIGICLAQRDMLEQLQKQRKKGK